MTRPTHCPLCGGRVQLDLAGKAIAWRPTGFTARIPSRCVDCSTQLVVHQNYVDGDRLQSWSITNYDEAKRLSSSWSVTNVSG